MKREEFAAFVGTTLERVVCLAEEKSGKKLSRDYAFAWLGRSAAPSRDSIVERIVQRVFVDDENIYPCVDIGVADLLEDGSPLIVGSVAGYPPRPFGKNWTGREGPFIHIVGQPFLAKAAGGSSGWTLEHGVFGYVIPDMKNL